MSRTINSGFSIAKQIAEALVIQRAYVDSLRTKPGYMAANYAEDHAAVLALDGMWLHAKSFGPRTPNFYECKPSPCHYVTTQCERRLIDAKAAKLIARFADIYQ